MTKVEGVVAAVSGKSLSGAEKKQMMKVTGAVEALRARIAQLAEADQAHVDGMVNMLAAGDSAGALNLHKELVNTIWATDKNWVSPFKALIQLVKKYGI